MFLITGMIFFPLGHRTSTCPLGQELTTLILVSFTFEKSSILQCRRPLPIAINKNMIYLSVWNWRIAFPALGSLKFYSSCFQFFLFSFFTVTLHSYTVKYMFLNFSTQYNSIGRRNRRWKTALESLFTFTLPVFKTKQGA